MSSLSVRISDKTHQNVQELAKSEGQSMQSIIDVAIENYRRQCLLEEANRQYAALRADPVAWQEELEERAVLEGSLLDDLEEE